MINFRKAFCKNAKKCSWWYELCDCQRYEPTVPPLPPEPPPPPPPPPVIKKCDIPYWKTGKLPCFSGGCLTITCSRDGQYFKAADLPAYFDCLVENGINSLRSLSAFMDESPEWSSYVPGRDADYYEHFHYVLSLIRERDLTLILSLMPYKGWLEDDVLRKLIQAAKIYKPNVIFEPANEERNLDRVKHIVSILEDEGITPKYISIPFIDSGDYAQYLKDGGYISCCHCCGSEATMDKWWAGSPGCQQLMSLGLYPSDDGEDQEKQSTGYDFWSNPQTRKPSPTQLYHLCKYFLRRTVGFDHLSASAFRGFSTPNLKQEMELGSAEMQAMGRAYKEVMQG